MFRGPLTHRSPTPSCQRYIDVVSPLEPLDLIIDFLHGDPVALKSCCIVSKSWAPRARLYLFAHVVFHADPRTDLPQIRQWAKTFPDPSNSSARYTRSLMIHGCPASIVPNAS